MQGVERGVSLHALVVWASMRPCGWSSAPPPGRAQVSVIVQITDVCPECGADHIDIQALTYNKLSPMSTGRISIQYRRVECVPPQRIVVSVDNNNGAGGWLRLFVEARPAAPPPWIPTRAGGECDKY